MPVYRTFIEQTIHILNIDVAKDNMPQMCGVWFKKNEIVKGDGEY